MVICVGDMRSANKLMDIVCFFTTQSVDRRLPLFLGDYGKNLISELYWIAVECILHEKSTINCKPYLLTFGILQKSQSQREFAGRECVMAAGNGASQK